MPTYQVKPTDPARIAHAVVRYQVTRLRFWLSVAAVLLGVGVLASGRGTLGVVTATLSGALVLAAVVLIRRHRLRSALAARGYRPGAMISADFGGVGFTLTTSSASARHDYTAIAHACLVRDVVVLRLGQAKLLLVLPLEVVPQPWLDRVLRAGARA